MRSGGGGAVGRSGRPRWSTFVVLVATVALIAPVGVAAAQTSPAGPSLVANGSFEAPDLSAWSGSGGADIARVRRPSSFHGGHALAVSSGGLVGSGVTTAATRDTDAGSHQLTLAVKATGSSVGKVVRAVVVDPSSGERRTSAAVYLQPWWQTVVVTADTGEGRLTFAVEEQPTGEAWTSGDRYLVDAVEAGAAEPTVASTSGRQLLVDGDPYAIRGYGYSPNPPGGALAAAGWNTNPAQCQSDAQLMRAAGVNTLRINFYAATYDETSYRQCMDAFDAAGVGLLWLFLRPGCCVGQQDSDAWVEAFWADLRFAVERVRDHPATLGYVIGNEIDRGEDDSAEWLAQLDELARRTEQLDPNHVTTTSLATNQFRRDVSPDAAPNLDLWGDNQYGYPDGWAQEAIDLDPTRPTWISEFGTTRYNCHQFGAALGLQIVLNRIGCSLQAGSGEDVAKQVGWLTWAWNEISANLSADDPDGAVVGGSIHAWSDYWWFNVPAFAGTPGGGAGDSPWTHDVWGRQRNRPVEWFGTTHAMPADHPGPRVSTRSYERVAELYTGTAGPDVSNASVTDVGPCSATVTWTTDVPTHGRVDLGLDDKVVVGGDVGFIKSDNFLADRWVQGSELANQHRVTVTGLRPQANWKAHIRSFDAQGRAGHSDGLPFRTVALDQLGQAQDCSQGAASGGVHAARGWVPHVP